eukprot:SAG31_NODE_15592_length_747_cov_1.953704_1_plen_33_part_10
MLILIDSPDANESGRNPTPHGSSAFAHAVKQTA